MTLPAPYMHWAKTRPAARFDLAISNMFGCTIADLPGAAAALALDGRNDSGYPPLLEAIGRQYDVTPDRVTTAQGASGANFLVCAALVGPGDHVLVEQPGYDPLMGAARLLGAEVTQFERRFEEGYALDPARIAGAMTGRTRLIMLTSPHNPTGVVAGLDTLREIGEVAAAHGAYVLVDEVYIDTAGGTLPSASALGERFIVTSSLTKSYGLAGLRCGWILSSPAVAERLRRARDVVDGTGSIVAERLSVLAFAHLDALRARTRALLATNVPLALDFVRSRPELAFVEPQGGTVVFPRILGSDDVSAFAARLLQERDTAIVPGRFFQAPAHFRLGFSGPTEVLREGLERLGEALSDPRSEVRGPGSEGRGPGSGVLRPGAGAGH
jgi:aspartate/methionine/tyrosine aminotransferase